MLGEARIRAKAQVDQLIDQFGSRLRDEANRMSDLTEQAWTGMASSAFSMSNGVGGKGLNLLDSLRALSAVLGGTSAPVGRSRFSVGVRPLPVRGEAGYSFDVLAASLNDAADALAGTASFVLDRMNVLQADVAAAQTEITATDPDPATAHRMHEAYGTARWDADAFHRLLVNLSVGLAANADRYERAEQDNHAMLNSVGSGSGGTGGTGTPPGSYRTLGSMDSPGVDVQLHPEKYGLQAHPIPGEQWAKYYTVAPVPDPPPGSYVEVGSKDSPGVDVQLHPEKYGLQTHPTPGEQWAKYYTVAPR